MLLGLYAILIIGLSITGLVILIVQCRKLVFLPAAEEIPKGARFKTAYLNPGSILFILLCVGFMIYALL